jgi:hypothetical protein
VDGFGAILGFDFDPIGTAVREREVGDGDALAVRDVENVIARGLAVPSLAAEDGPGRISRGASKWPSAKRIVPPGWMRSTAASKPSTVAT